MNQLYVFFYFIFVQLFYNNMIVLFCFVFTLFELTFQQCPTSGFDFTKNQVKNGGFQSPQLITDPTYYPGGFYPWTTPLAQIGTGFQFNSNWPIGDQVACLDTGVGQSYTQSFYINYTGSFFFSVDFAKAQNYSPSTSGLRIYWNGKNVAQQPTASDDLIHQLTVELNSVIGLNTIVIQAMGHDDHNGTTIDNVGVYPFVDYHRVNDGTCSCGTGYFDNGYNYQCVSCSSMLQYCSACTFSPNLTQTLLNLNCTSYVIYGAACSYGSFLCTNCESGYFLTSSNTCEPLQITPNFYEPDWDLTYVPCNQFKGNFEINLPSYLSLQKLIVNNTQVGIEYDIIQSDTGPDMFKMSILANYISDISEQTLSFTVFYIDTTNTLNTQGTIIKMRASNMPLIYYTDGECASKDPVENFTVAIVVISYFVMFFSLISLKIVGLELFGVLQLAHFSLATHDNVNMYLQPLLKWKYVNGFNVETDHPISKVSNTLNLMSYKDNFFYNINFMFAVLLVNLIVGGIIYIVAKRKSNQKMSRIAKYILKLVFITLFLFNSMNLSFSIGLHFKYADPVTTQLYGLGTIGALVGIGLYIFAAGYMQFTEEKEFGEYKNKFKKNCVNKFYIPLSILYRFILGVYIAQNNDWYLGTLIILAVSIAFIMFNVINLPFKRAYQNYRANMCHFIQLLILLVSNFYRSMKANTSLNQKARIHWPAILQLVAIFFCVIISFICLVYEIVTELKRYLKRRKALQKVDGESEAKIVDHILSIFNQNGGNTTKQNNNNNFQQMNKTEENIQAE